MICASGISGGAEAPCILVILYSVLLWGLLLFIFLCLSLHSLPLSFLHLSVSLSGFCLASGHFVPLQIYRRNVMSDDCVAFYNLK